jgi:P27 family predicted phage terminase small subunit
VRGRPRKPPQLRLLEGKRGHRPIEFGPKFKTGFGPPPRSLDAESKKLWRTISKALSEHGISARVYRTMLEGLCLNYSRAMQAERVLQEKGLTIEMVRFDDRGHETGSYVQQRPEVSIASKAWAAVRLYCSEFGLSPASNGKVSVPKTRKESLRDTLMAENVR